MHVLDVYFAIERGLEGCLDAWTKAVRGKMGSRKPERYDGQQDHQNCPAQNLHTGRAINSA